MKYKDSYNQQELLQKTGLSVKELHGMKPPSWVLMKLIKSSGRSWWQAMYAGGKVISEWETLQSKILNPLGDPSTSRWEEIGKRGLRVLRLLSPSGNVAELRTEIDYALFQLKSGVISIGVNEEELHCHYHIIGAVVDTNGNCECRSWDYKNNRMLKFQDNVTRMAFDNIGTLNLDAVGIK